MESQERAVLAEAAGHLLRIGSANDAEDHGYEEDAARMREEACAALRELLDRHPFLGALLPGLRGELDTGHILAFGWSSLLDEIERRDPMTISSSASDTPPDELQPRYPESYWDSAAEHLQLCQTLHHNGDYLEFLVTRVWQLDRACRLAEFGCGCGTMGLRLMPLLARGSTYAGIDRSHALVSEGRRVWADAPWPAEFHEGSIYETPFADRSFDVTMTHTVLMHVPHPEKVLREMIRVTRPGGLVIACEANRNAHAAMLHIDEVNHQEAAPLGLFQTINRGIRERTGVDHNIGAKLPVLMHRAGLKQVRIRVSDAAVFLWPPLDTDYKKRVFEAICDEGYGQPRPSDEQRARWKANLLSYGISEQDAEAEIARELDEDFLNKGPQYHTVYASLLTWSFGVV